VDRKIAAVGCGVTVVGPIGLRHFGQVSFIKKSIGMVSLFARGEPRRCKRIPARL
jgi:hypothetical protein